MAENSLMNSEKDAEYPLSIKPNLKGDWLNCVLLVILYTIQSLPHGFIVVLPLIFQSNKSVTYADQAFFSLVTWPAAFKLLWAPIVDSVYVQKFGRRKSWIIPIQYIMGVILFFAATNINNWMPETGKPNFNALFVLFGTLQILISIQDVALDGWALTMLKKRNVAYSSTCALTGVALGELMCSFFILLLTSENFCNKYIRHTHGTGGIVNIKWFMYFWSAAIISITTIVLIFKSEPVTEDGKVGKISFAQSYKVLWDIFKIPNVRVISVILLTSKIGFTTTDSLTYLTLIDYGIHRDILTTINLSIFSFKFLLPLILSKYTSGMKPMSAMLNVYLIRLFWGLTYVILIYYTPSIIKTNGVMNVPVYYYVILEIIRLVQEITIISMQIFITGFFSRVSDKRFGGTYYTLLDAFYNMGTRLPKYIVVKSVNVLTFKKCVDETQNTQNSTNYSTTSLENSYKTNNKDNCTVIVNGFYIESAICITIGLIWYFSCKKTIKRLEYQRQNKWWIRFKPLATEDIQL